MNINELRMKRTLI